MDNIKDQQLKKLATKLAKYAIVLLGCYIITIVLWIWTIVEFLIYLFKDDNPFNWLSLTFVGIFAVATIWIYLKAAVVQVRVNEEIKKNSKWAKRLEEAQTKQKKK